MKSLKIDIIGCLFNNNYKEDINVFEYHEYLCKFCEFQLHDKACELVKYNNKKHHILGEIEEQTECKLDGYKYRESPWIIFGCDVAGTEIGRTLENMLNAGM